MSNHGPAGTERHCDVAVVGGSAAGLAAALQLGRQRRSVIVIDAGEARNAPAAHMHGYLGYEATPPAAVVAAGREEVRSYGGEVLAGRVTTVTATADGRFRVALVGDHAVVARRVLAATGLVDELPDIPGVAEQWGRAVVHCPFCHGYEARDRRVVQIVTDPLGLHTTPLFRQLSAELTVVLHRVEDPDPDTIAALRAAGVAVRSEAVSRLRTGDDGHLQAVELEGGDRLDADVVAVGPRFRARVEPFLPLGLRPVAHPSGLGDHVETDGNGATSVSGLYAAGNVTDPGHQVLQAAAQGGRVGAMIALDLANDDLALAVRNSANEADWDHRYGAKPMWSGNPNGSLVNEVAALAPGRALDVGAGEGGDALWLAERGWDVTASDISSQALGRIRAEAERREVVVQYLHTDANADAPFEAGAFDLVSAQYASIPRTPDDRGVTNLLAAVAPGGILLVVSHDLEPMRVPIDIATQSRAFDPDAYVRTDDVARVLASTQEWEIEVHEKRPRPAGAASTHHVDDVVLRARRRKS